MELQTAKRSVGLDSTRGSRGCGFSAVSFLFASLPHRIILSVYRKEDGYYGTRVDRSDRTHDDLVQPQDHHPRGGLERGDQEEGEFQSVPARFRPARIGMGACIFWSRVMGGK